MASDWYNTVGPPVEDVATRQTRERNDAHVRHSQERQDATKRQKKELDEMAARHDQEAQADFVSRLSGGVPEQVGKDVLPGDNNLEDMLEGSRNSAYQQWKNSDENIPVGSGAKPTKGI